MSYELAILPEAEKEWQQLDGSIKQLFKKQLRKCLQHPRIPKKQLSGYSDYY
jgi:mRNA interferase RelE/StbE